MSDKDDELWAQMTQDVDKIKHDQVLKDETLAENSPKKPARTPPKPLILSKVEVPKATGSGLDRKTAEKLRKGQMPIDGRLDLHGMRQIEAQEALQSFITASYSAGKRCVLVITGKGTGLDGRRDPLSQGQGVLKRGVPEWLSDASLAPLILKVEKARPQHGGDGALYVLLRRQR